MSGAIVTHGDGKARFDRGVVGAAGQFAAVRQSEPPALVSRDAVVSSPVWQPPAHDALAKTLQQVDELREQIFVAQKRQQIKDLAGEIRRREPKAATFTVTSIFDKGRSVEYLWVSELSDADGMELDSSALGLRELRKQPNRLLPQYLSDFTDLLPPDATATAVQVEGFQHTATVNIEQVSRLDVHNGSTQGTTWPFATSQLLEGAVKAVRKEEVQRSLDRIDEMRGQFPEDLLELRVYDAGRGPKQLAYIGRDGNIAEPADTPIVAEMRWLVNSFHHSDLYDINDRVDWVSGSETNGGRSYDRYPLTLTEGQ